MLSDPKYSFSVYKKKIVIQSKVNFLPNSTYTYPIQNIDIPSLAVLCKSVHLCFLATQLYLKWK